MDGFAPATSVGPTVAASYDDHLRGDEDATVDFLHRLRQHPEGTAIAVTVGHMAQVQAPGAYPLAYLVFDTIYNLLTQDDQVRCSENAARHLDRDGVVVVEAGVPSAWVRGDQFVDVRHVATDEVLLDANRYDAVTQILDESHISLTAAGVRLEPISLRLIWPAELDLMARIAGLTLRERWADGPASRSRQPAPGTSASTGYRAGEPAVTLRARRSRGGRSSRPSRRTGARPTATAPVGL